METTKEIFERLTMKKIEENKRKEYINNLLIKKETQELFDELGIDLIW